MLVLCILGALIFTAAAVVLYKKGHSSENRTRRLCLVTAAFVVFSLGAELTVFNINSYATASYSEVSLTPYLESRKNESGSYTVTSSDSRVTFPEVYEKIKNIRIRLAPDNTLLYADVEIDLTDEANSFYYSTPVRTVYADVEKSQYINIHTSGVSKNLAVDFKLDEGRSLHIEDISINTARPFEFSFLRVVLVFVILIFFAVFKPSSPLYKKKCGDSDTRPLMHALVCLECAVIIILASINPLFTTVSVRNSKLCFDPMPMQNHNQYDELAQAILNGKTYIDNDDVPESLKQMQNPYDTTLRYYTALDAGEDYRWDVAYYNGHYYVYFGIVPLALMYLPFRAVFDAPFPTFAGIIVFAALFTLGVYELLYFLCTKKYPHISAGAFLLTGLTFVNCCGMTFLAKRPDFYSVPIICGMTFSVWGLVCWFKALESEKRKRQLGLFFAGALCMALVAGCRPQLVLLSVLALPLFAKRFFKGGYILKKKGLCELAVLAAPYIAVAAVIMVYNYMRFSSPFDFGSAYNLTTNDVTRRGFEIARTGTGLFTYLFQTPKFTAVFPFLKKTEIATEYVGRTVTENCFGGLITSLPVLWFLLALPQVKTVLKEKNLFAFTLLTVVCGFAVCIADTQAGGLLQRYYSDFGFIFFLAAALIIFSLFEKHSQNAGESRIFTKLLFLSSITAVFYAVCLAFSVSDVTIDSQNPVLFGTLFEAVQFWL